MRSSLASSKSTPERSKSPALTPSRAASFGAKGLTLRALRQASSRWPWRSRLRGMANHPRFRPRAPGTSRVTSRTDGSSWRSPGCQELLSLRIPEHGLFLPVRLDRELDRHHGRGAKLAVTVKIALSAKDIDEVPLHVAPRLRRQLGLRAALVLCLELLAKVAVGAKGSTVEVERAVLAANPLRELRVVRERAQEEDAELARVVGGKDEHVRDVAAVLFNVKAAAGVDAKRVFAAGPCNRQKEGRQLVVKEVGGHAAVIGPVLSEAEEVLRSPGDLRGRSEEHTSELQSRLHLVCRLLLEKKKKQRKETHWTNTTA